MNTDRIWIKSSFSDDTGECIEVAACPCIVLIRDSKLGNSPQIRLSPAAWMAFIGHTE
ncbi:DUF397 domain-containing protein [Streptomyces morookaense]|uniref:DUF397 domain-containing protein n=1 Tax=Streptomyces morookaense TaxID=1970 RepID=A0A7Y7B5Z7_STRMO|nr:DUF397 domain-containing protein [Streptomyces morookaense]NVK79226.1 DUF397 domain-containing protein [Streptomyces morookaense]GHF27632.1 DUF397 domain-containing protein [Streptomyces morookaense]